VGKYPWPMPTTLYAVPGKEMGVVEIQSNNAKEMEVVEIQSNDSAYNVAPQRLANPVTTSSISGLEGGQQLQDGEKKQTRLQKFIHWLDVYAVEPREPNSHGVMITISIIGASLAYAVVLFIEQQNAPLREVAAVLWTSSYTFPATVQCISPSGCKISNTLDPDKVTKCYDVRDKEKIDVRLGWGPDPEKGLSVVAQAASVSSHLFIIDSDMYMEPLPGANPNPMGPIEDNVVNMATPILQGTSLAWYVQTRNHTRYGKGAMRHEYFVQSVNFDGAPMAGSTPCSVPDGWVQSRVRMMPQWNQVTVEKPEGWLEWFGTASGMYAAFVSWGAMLLGTWEGYSMLRDHR